MTKTVRVDIGQSPKSFTEKKRKNNSIDKSTKIINNFKKSYLRDDDNSASIKTKDRKMLGVKK